MARLQLKQIEKSYDGDVKVIHGIDLDVRSGEFMVFVGPSGCGKSTLLRMIAGLEDISGGELRIGERVVNDVPPAQRGIAMVFQSYALYPHMTVAENMGFALKLAGTPKAQLKASVERAAEILQITHLLDRKPKALSGGQRQRVAIGRAIVRKPQVFLFDEPLSNLDAALRVQMRVELSRLHRELGTTMVYVTHDQVEAMTLGQRIVVFNGGRIEQVGTPLELYEHPANLFVAGFLGSPRMNFLPVKLGPRSASEVEVLAQGGAGFKLGFDTTQSAFGAAATLGVRPDHLALAPAGAPGLPGRVELVEHLGDAALVHVRCEGLTETLVARVPGANRLPLPGDACSLQPEAGRASLFDADGRALPRAAR
ncbi:sn-glycerol-3-phosphate ABC transporter ATP-binding protein UgpC [Aquabacterium sp. A7-Y]|uniref:ABC transporter ATP-binding protein n=1 Tax=Aquabacterium sp. A7-Y TaxID=1349605 RepID=UPI00223DEA0A|nr:sn-glycerol-3-phosphate ABC transporter ATP-binding protein UgpC [Aquabacterium sp. A7-Y]MCW7542035.1 sn-glycerol-3-phosphate ABC transporter ATP-binding protein UgpC [Aquabacterium sp. A7-Y]